MACASIPAALGLADAAADAGAAAATAGAATAAATSGAAAAGLVVPLTTASGALLTTLPAAGGIASTLSTVGAIGAGLGGVAGAAGAVESGIANSKSASYQAAVAANNQTIAKNDATMAEAAGATQVEQSALKTKATVGAIKASQAASNVNVNSGSAVDVRTGAAETGQLNVLNLRGNAEKQAYGYETQAAGFGGQQSLAQSEAAQAPVAAGISGTGSLLSGASGVATQYANWQRVAGASGVPLS